MKHEENAREFTRVMNAHFVVLKPGCRIMGFSTNR